MFLKSIYAVSLVILLLGCSFNKLDPAKQAPTFTIQVQNFDSAFFAMDTLHTAVAVQKLIQTYPNFAVDYFSKILMLNGQKDSLAIKAFYKAYLPIYKDAQKLNALALAKSEMENGFRHLHYYFPKYPLTHKVVGFIGPLESYGNIVMKDGLAVGLQMYLGANSDWYYSERIQTIYPAYMSRRFTPAYIAVNSVQNILNDIVPPSNKNLSLISQMIEEGKRQYIINACFPETPDTIRFGYTALQMNELEKQESKIWEYVLHSKLSFSTNPVDIQNMMQESLYSDVFGELVPGNVGKYIGYKIVAKWMQLKPQKSISMEALLQTTPDEIFTEASYAP